MGELKVLHEDALLFDFAFWNQVREMKVYYFVGVTVLIAFLLIFLLLTCLFQKTYFTKLNFVLTTLIYVLVILTLGFDVVQLYLSITNFNRFKGLDQKNCGGVAVNSVIYQMHNDYRLLNLVL